MRWNVLLLICLLLSALPDSHSQVQRMPDYPGEAEIHLSRDTVAIKTLIGNGIQIKEKDRDSALTLLEEGLRQSRLAGYPYGIATATFYIGNIYISIGLFRKSLDIFNECVIHMIRTPGMTNSLPFLYGNIASVYIYLGNYEAAALYLYKAVAFMQNLPFSNNAINLYNNLGVTLLNMPDVYQPAFQEKAKYYLDLAEHNARQGNHRELLAAAFTNKGEFYTKQGNWAKAHKYLDSVLEMVRDIHLPEIQLCALMTKGEIYMKQHQPETALRYFQAAYEIKNVNPYYTIMAETHLGKVYYEIREYKKAENLLLKAKHSALDLHLDFNLLEIYRTLSGVYKHTHQYQAALEHHEAYTALKDHIAGRETVTNVNQLEIKYRTAQKDKELIQKQLLISEQARKIERNNMLTGGIISGALVLTLLFTGLYRSYRHRQKLQTKQIHILQQEQKLLLREQEVGQLKAMMQGEERERTRIARELHDGIGGMLATVKMYLGTMKKDYPALTPAAHFTKAIHMLEDTSEEVRKTAHNLMPDILIRHNLQKALETYCESINATGHIHIDIQFYNLSAHITKTAELMLYRIIQELLQNIIKHAQATRGEIQIVEHEGILSIMVEDNGIGFDTEAEHSGFGLQNLRYRVQGLQGYLSITSVKGKSTTIHIEFSLENLKLAGTGKHPLNSIQS